MVQVAPWESENLKGDSEKGTIEFTGDFLEPTLRRQLVVVRINAGIVRKAEALIRTCEHCNEEGTEFPFAAILDRVTGSDPKVTDYVLEQPAKCSNCKCDIFEKTLIEPVRRMEDQ